MRNFVFLLVCVILPISIYAKDQMTLKGKYIQYKVGEFSLCINFLEERKLKWFYKKAPNGLTGKSAIENIDRLDITKNISFLSWSEKDGSHINDVIDLENKKIYTMYVSPKGKRFISKSKIKIPRNCQ